MRGQVRVFLAFVSLLLLFGAGPAAAGGGAVFLLRGGLNVFSTGMDELAVKLRARGVNAKSTGHADWQTVADEAERMWKKNHTPIVLLGHSWGANADILVADALKERDVPVALIVMFDPTTVLKVPSNVKRAVNYYSTTANGLGLQLQRGFGFSGPLVNQLEPVGHLDIDNWPPLQEKAIAQVLGVVRGR